MLRRGVKLAGAALGAGTAATASWIASDEGRRRGAYSAWVMGKIGFQVQYKTYAIKDKTEAEQAKIMSEMHTHHAKQALAFVLDLKGYYIKVAQTLCGFGVLPKEYDDAFAPLLDDCPSEPFSIVKAIVEAELKCSIDEAYASFDERPIGAASIGQVHKATLKDGTNVVVKVQYPDVERFFRIDLEAIKTMTAFGDFKEVMIDAMDGLAETFASEFDYTVEAAYLRECSENASRGPYAASVHIPLPIDAKHPSARGLSTAAGLCTRKVLTMEAVPGEPIKKKVQRLMEAWAASKGQTVAQLQHDLAAQFSDPEQVRRMQQAKPPSAAAVAVGIALMRLQRLVTNVSIWLFNLTVGTVLGRRSYAPSVETLNGPRLIQLLANVHAHQIFVDGVYNTDPHAGNVLIMPDLRLGLIDYGAAERLTPKQQRAFAKVLIAIADNDLASLPSLAKDFGWMSAKQDPLYINAYMLICFHRGYNMDDMYALGVPRHVGMHDLELWLAGLDKVTKLPSHILPLQRCVMVLLGLAGEIGAHGISIACMWRDEAQRYLDTHPE